MRASSQCERSMNEREGVKRSKAILQGEGRRVSICHYRAWMDVDFLDARLGVTASLISMPRFRLVQTGKRNQSASGRQIQTWWTKSKCCAA